MEASGDAGGTFRSENMGENWTRTSRYQSGAAIKVVRHAIMVAIRHIG